MPRFSEYGGGIWHDDTADTIEISNSIIAGNSADGGSDDIAQGGSSLDVRFSLIGVANGPDAPTINTDFNQTGTQVTPLNPLLGPLADNGGSTQTHAPLVGSPAIDAGFNFRAKDQNGNDLLFDQRGFNRIFNANADGSATVDLGAVELNPPLVVSTRRDEGGVLKRPDLINTFAATFNADVVVTANDLVIRNDTLGGAVVDTSTLSFSYDSANRTAAWDFGSLLLDPAFYLFELSNTITSSGLSLDGDANGTAGGNYAQSIYVALPGDANLDGQVNVLSDAFTLVGNLGVTSGASWAQGNFNDDEAVNVLGDAFILVGRLGQSVVPPASTASSVTAKATSLIATAAVTTQVSALSDGAQSPSFISDHHDAHDWFMDVKRASHPPDPTGLSLAGSQDLDAAFESGDLVEALIF